MDLFTHLRFDIEDIQTYGMNFVMYKDSKDTLMTVTTGSAKNVVEGFMNCLKLPNKEMCDICNYKKKCFRQCVKCKHKLCFECFKNHNKDYINSCPYCRFNMVEHSKTNNMTYDMLG